jgi:acetyl esterase/lipase
VALQDAVTAYKCLLYMLKVRPENTILSGDSAGGNLVLAQLRYVHYTQEPKGAADSQLPSPAAALIWAFRVNLESPGVEIDHHRNTSTDFTFEDLGDWGIRAYVPQGWNSKYSLYAYIGPLGREFHTDVPIFVNTSRAEVLYDSNYEFLANFMKKGCMVEFLESDQPSHVTFETADSQSR